MESDFQGKSLWHGRWGYRGTKKAFNNFKDNGEALLLEAEKLFSLDDKNRYTPKTVLFERNGDVALLLDDNKDPDDGMVAILSPNMQLLSQDDYLVDP